jgi:N-acetylmuramoyl-L-alanine amidase
MRTFLSLFCPAQKTTRRGRFSIPLAAVLVRLCLVAILLAPLVPLAVETRIAEGAPNDAPLDYPVANGRFFTQANGNGGGGSLGYGVTDEGGIRLWTAMQQLGGPEVVGYPVSQRFEWNGFSVQAFQKLVLQWRPETGSVSFINVFDELNQAGKDPWLRNVRSTPERLGPNEDGKSWDQVVADRISWLDDSPGIKARYLGTADYVTRYGLPTSRIEDVGDAQVVRFQRAVMQLWKVNVPWAKAGDVTVANGGDIGKEAGLYPRAAVALEESPTPAEPEVQPVVLPSNPSSLTVAIDPGHGGNESGSTQILGDGSRILEKDVNLKVALLVEEELRRLGYKVVMTRRTDINVHGGRDTTGDGRVSVQDDLQARVDIANQSRANIFVSIHHNGHRDGNVRGTEVYYCKDRPFSANSIRLAKLTQESLVGAMAAVGYKTQDRGVKDGSSALGQGRHYFLLGPKGRLIVRPSEMPSIIGEGLFVSNASEANLLRQPTFLSAIAKGYVTAINRYFGK